MLHGSRKRAAEVIAFGLLGLLLASPAAAKVGSNASTARTAAAALSVDNQFVSATGWVKPGQSYVWRVFVRNTGDKAASTAKVELRPVSGMAFTAATPATSSDGTTALNASQLAWYVGKVPAGSVKTLIVEARAKTLSEDATLVWKDLSSTATLTSPGLAAKTSKSAGPKVIPPDGVFDTARYGLRPFPVIPVDYLERKHAATRTAEKLTSVINDASVEGSTYNLYQEMSLGQLQPRGTVPSAGIATRDWANTFTGRYKDTGFQFTQASPQGTCTGATLPGPAQGTPAYPLRISGGWYQLPGNTGYYGADRVGPLAVPGTPILGDIDGGCGPTGKLTYDAVHIADPDIDYSDYDTDKDGVVDFVMVVFAGLGGNGSSQTGGGYDNVWPHSSTLEAYYNDPVTNLKGYISDDQLKDYSGRPMFYVDNSYTKMTTTQTPFPVWVRVGAYNVNPEAAIDKASVISHEYGHSLGLPDFYTASGRSTYGDWNLMATDKSQHMDIFSKQELGWVVPRILKPGETVVSGFRDSKADINRIEWQRADGTPYVLEGANVHNAEAYAAPLPKKRIIDPAIVPSGSHLWWSGAGDMFGCTPVGAHNMDLALPQLESLAPGTAVTLSFKSWWNIEWDFDYGFVLVSTDGGTTYTSLASQNGFTTPAAVNPTANSCQAQFGNGLTGSSGSYGTPPTHPADRALGEYPTAVFRDDAYDLTPYAGQHNVVLRFSYATDPGVANPGWFIDDLKVAAGANTLFSDDFENGQNPQIFNGGCSEDLQTGKICTDGFIYVNAAGLSSFDHAYFLEMRDRSGFDLSGRNQNSRAAIGFQPGMLLVYTNEINGYGNFSGSGTKAPNQSPLDSVPVPGATAPNLNDAAFTTAAPGRASFSDAKTAARPGGWIDNYADDKSAYGDNRWHFDFNCLTFDVLSISGGNLLGPHGPLNPPWDLTGDVRFTLGEGCGPMNYGFGVAGPNQAPVAVAAAKPTTAAVGEEISFSGLGSSDDRQMPDALSYAWDFEQDGTVDAEGSTAQHAYSKAGIYRATLTVTDSKGLRGTDVVRITVQ